MEPWQEEILINIKRILNSGIKRGIVSENGELLDYCNHLLNLLEQTKLIEVDMNSDRHEKYEEFKRNKEALRASLAEDFEKAFLELGDDIKKLSWFVSTSKRENSGL